MRCGEGADTENDHHYGPGRYPAPSNAADEKTLGIFTFGAMAEGLGFPLPDGVRKKELVVIGIIGGFGFTVALFIAGEAFIDPALQGAAKMGAMLSFVAAVVAIVVARALKIKRKP
jgi:NhaA family Na+:H+ antiporter